MKKLALALCALAAASAHAGVKYWTTGNYDADSYVQEGLVLNYDGIRNVGIDQPHSMTTTTWVNLANPGTHDLSFYAKTSGATTNWLDNGYLFNNGTVFREMSSNLVVPGKQTTQVLMDATCANISSLGYVWFPGQVGSDNTYWQTWSVSIRDKNTKQIWYNTHAYTTDRPKWNGTEFSYLTALANETYTAAFSGTEEPTSTPGRYPTKTDVVFPSRTMGSWAIGGQPNGSDSLNGSIKSFRLYSNKVLSTDELIWNRAVDDARFFGKLVSAIPVTNAVIASAVANVSGNEKAGAYAVDASGYTFSTPASKTVDGRAYTCTGYTLEAWDDATGDWGAPEDHSGSLSCAVTETSRVRITWQWTAGDGIVTRYTTADYVQDGLLLHYDGIRNLGADQPHSSNMTAWKNLAPAGGWDMTLQVINTEGADPGEWRDDGYHFERQSYFHPGAAFTLPSNQTIQVAVDANGLGQKAYNGSSDSNEAYIYYAMGVEFNKAGSLSLRRDLDTSYYNEWFDWTVHGYGDSNTRPKPGQFRGLPVRYCTAVLADTFGAAFMGTSVPTEQTVVNGFLASRRDFTAGPPIVQNATDFGIGGIVDNSGRKFTGTLQSFRFYGRVLTDAELEHNRMVDDYRFHGVMPVTNVLVTSSRLGMDGNEKIGPYEISGTYTFTAPATRTDARGIEFACTGYTLEAWNASEGCWDSPVLHDGVLSFEYVVATSPAKVRLTWQWKAAGALFTAADYDITDYVAGGLVLNYDGIKNIGAELPDVTNRFSCLSKAWANSAPFGGWDMSFIKKGGASTWLGDSTWTDNGFTFANRSFFSNYVAFVVSPKSTQQTLVEGIGNSLNNGGSLDNGDTPRGYVFMASGAWNKAGSFSFVSNNKNSWVDLAAHGFSGTTADSRCDPCLDLGANLTYATGIMGDGYMAAFYGTEIPPATTTRWRNPSRLPTSGFGLEPTTVAVTYLGAGGNNGAQAFTGTVKSYRYYDRPLANEELVRNRQVDSARYFGELAFTNVVVAVGDDLDVTATPAPGAYAVEGTYTFSVEAGNDAPNGYKLEEWDGTQWSNAQVVESLSYTYDAATSPAMVRVTWRKVNPFVLMMR
ncbi:MAG: hypothetical protein ILM98_02600 [Kiritimatiellae bacterium]|nr:hypothetical protein [Kiritimatiellia bacterium]